jgi:hypothetical protein
MAYTVQSSAAALNRAFNNANATPTAFATTVADLTAGTIAAANKFDDGTLSDLALSTKVLTNMGILPSTVAEVVALEAALADYFGTAGKDNRGFVVLQLSEIVSAITSSTDPLYVYYGAAAAAWNTEITASATDSSAQAFSLTTATTDSLTGGQDADTFSGVLSILASTLTLNASDKIAGGAGNDVLNLTASTAWNGFTTGSMAAVETVNITSAGTTAVGFNGTGTTGVTTISVNAATVDVADAGTPVALSNVNSGLTTLTLDNLNITTTTASAAATAMTENVTLAYVSGAAEETATTDALALNLSNVGKTAYQTVTINLADIETVNVASNTANFVNFAGTDLRALNVTGSGALTIGTVPTSIRTFDASAATGVVDVTLTAVTTAAQITSVKTGSGNDAIALAEQDASANATINAGAGTTDTLTLTSDGGTVEYAMTGVEVLSLSDIDTALVISGTNTSGLTSVKTTSTSGAGVSLVNMGTGDLAFTSTGTTQDAGDIESDHSGATTVTFAAGSTSSLYASLGDMTFSKSAGALTVTVGNYNAIPDTNGSVITGTKASSLNLTVNSAKDATGLVEKTSFASTIDVPVATSFAVTSNGELVTGADIQAPKATSGVITNGSNGGYLTVNAPLLTTLTLTSGAAFSTASSTLTGLQNLTVDMTKGTYTAGVDFVKANAITLSGTGTTSGVDLNALGANTNNYDLTVTATGLNAGLDIGAVTLSSGVDATFNLTGVVGNVTITSLDNSSADDITIVAPGVGTGSDVATPTGIIVGTIAATGDVVVNAKGAYDAAIGTAGSTTITGDNVTVDISGTTLASTTGNISAKTSATVDLYALTANSLTITAASGSTALTADVDGGILVDTITVDSSITGQTSMIVKGNLGAGTDVVTVNGTSATAKSINLASLLNYDAATITGGSGSDTIVGGSGNDKIFGKGGTNVLTGGDGIDQFVFEYNQSGYAAINEITDYKSEDYIVYGNANIDAVISTAVSATPASDGTSYGVSVGYGATVTISTLGVATFTGTSTASDTIYEKMSLINDALNDVEGTAAFFAHSGTTYLYIGAGASSTSDIVVKLTGVVIPTATYTEDTSTDGTPSGLTAIGA